MKSNRNSNHQYEQLEHRQLLAVDVGVNFQESPFVDVQPATADVHGDIGPNHIVQLTTEQYTVRTPGGTVLQSFDLEFFFGQFAGADLVVDQDGFGEDVIGDVQDARVVFDSNSGRWFATAVVANADGSALMGNDVLLAVSMTDNPLDGFQSVQFIGDTTGDHFNNFASVAVSGDAVVITTDNIIDPLNTSTSVFAIPTADLIGATPSAINLARFQNLDPAVYGDVIQFATNQTADSASTFGIGTIGSGTELSFLELTNVGTGQPVELIQNNITVPFFSEAPDARQPNGVAPLNNLSPIFTGNVVSQGGFLWAVHAVEGSSGNSAIRWYQIDEATGAIANTGDIEDPNLDFTFPSIAVNEFGAFAIGYTGSGVGFDEAASSYLSLGFSVQGLNDIPTITIPQGPTLVQAGDDNIVNISDAINQFGEFSAVGVDPDDPFSFFSFQNIVASSNTLGIAITEASITAIDPVIAANDLGNEVIVRRNAINTDRIEFVFDGAVTDTFEIAAVDSYVLNLGDGDDTVTIDNSLASVFVANGLTVNGGDGTDSLRFIDSNGLQIDITGDGSGVVNGINVFTSIEAIEGGDGDDVFTANNTTSDFNLSGGAGDDLFDIENSATGAFVLEGNAGDDTFAIPLANFASIDVMDTGGSANDSLVGLGTTGDDELTVDSDGVETLIELNGQEVVGFAFPGIENLDFDVIEGNDVVNIRSLTADTVFFGNEGSDTFNISSDSPANTGDTSGITASLTIDAGDDATNRLVVSNFGGTAVDATLTTDQIIGFTTTPITFVGDFASDAVGNAGIELIGSQFADQIDVTQVLAENTVSVKGSGGDDIVNVRAAVAGDVAVDGGDGVDVVRSTFASVDRNVTINDTGADATEVDRLLIRSTDLADTLEIEENSIAVAGQTYAWLGVENVVFNTLEGDDVVTVGDGNETTAIRVILGDGDDSGSAVDLDGVGSLRFDGLEGDDSFLFASSVAGQFAQALGGVGNDVFTVGGSFLSQVLVDGQEGSDEVTVTFATIASRIANARDTGVTGENSLTILGTPAADQVDLRTRVVDRDGEIIAYDENTQILNLDLLGSNDTINVFGSAAEIVNGELGVGNDTLNVISTATPNDSVEFVFSLQAGNDAATIDRLSENALLQVFGQAGNDAFNVGSTLAENNGNLNTIRGDLFLTGGAGDLTGFDTLQINDAASPLAQFQYEITDSLFAHVPGPLNLTRPFDSFGHDGFEFIMASGNDAANTFTVTPSQTAVIRVDGNLGETFFGVGDVLDVRVPSSTSVVNEFNNDGTGFIEFSNGFENVSFEEIESVTTSSSSGFAFSVAPDTESFDDDNLRSALLEEITADLGFEI